MAAKLAAKTINTVRLVANAAAHFGGRPIATKGRRPVGDGSVYRTKDGRWRGVVDLGGDADGRRRKYVSGATQGQFLEKLRRAQREAQAGVVSDDRLTVGVFLDRWASVNLPGTVTGTPRTSTADDQAWAFRPEGRPD